MSPDIDNLSHHWSLAIFIIGAIGLGALLLLLARFMGGRSSGHSKDEPFESGVLPVGSARLKLSVKFYLVALLFIIFEAEALFLFAYAIAVREAGWSGFIAASIFVLILLVGLIYESRMGVLNGGQGQKNKRQKEV